MAIYSEMLNMKKPLEMVSLLVWGTCPVISKD